MIFTLFRRPLGPQQHPCYAQDVTVSGLWSLKSCRDLGPWTQSLTIIQFHIHIQGAFVGDYMSGSPLSYTIAYSNINSSGIYSCESVTVMVSSCENGLCSHQFHVSSIPSCRNSTNVIVIAFATNIFGNGSVSTTHLSEFSKSNVERNSSRCVVIMILH